MNPSRIRDLVAQLETSKSLDEENAWGKLKPLGPEVLPYFLSAYPKMKKWHGRVSLVFHSMKFARQYDEAFNLGIMATKDRATLVRYRACMLLAFSLRKEALPHLEVLLSHKDEKTAQDAHAAIDAIKNKNHHYFVDREHTGQKFWNINEYSA